MDIESAQDWVDENQYVESDGEFKPSFIVDTDEKAAWALRKYRAALDKITRTEDLADAETGRIAAWRQERTRIFGRDTDFFAGLLVQYALDQRHDFDRKKIDLPDGVVQTRLAGAKLFVSDREALIAWATNSDATLIRTKVEPDMVAIREAISFTTGVPLTVNGEIVPGLEIEPERVSATVKVSENE